MPDGHSSIPGRECPGDEAAHHTVEDGDAAVLPCLGPEVDGEPLVARCDQRLRLYGDAVAVPSHDVYLIAGVGRIEPAHLVGVTSGIELADNPPITRQCRPPTPATAILRPRSL